MNVYSKRHSLLFLSIFSCTAFGCSQEERSGASPVMTAESEKSEPQTSADSSETTPPAATNDHQTNVAGLAFTVPEGWEQVQLTDFQLGIISARYKITEGDQEITVTLSRSGGGVDANLVRWRGQVEANRDEVLERFTLAGQPAVLLDLQGKFSPGFGKPVADNQRMLGTIIEMTDSKMTGSEMAGGKMASQDYFIKLTGPAEAVSKAEDDFRKFIKSATMP